MTEDRIVRFKGGKARQDTTFSARGMTNNGVIASVPWGTNTAVITTIKDLTNGDSVTLTEVHGDKTAVKTSGEVQKLKATGTMVRLAGRPKPPPPADSGVAAKLGDYQTEVFDWTDAGGVRMKLWVAKAFPNYGAIVASLEKLYGLPAPDPTQGWIRLDLNAVPGLVVKSETTVYGTNVITITLISAREETVDASGIEVPKDYRLVEPRPPAGQAAAEAPAQPSGLTVGSPFPDFNVQALDGQPLSLASRKGKIVLLDFWATWCPPCRAEMPNVVAAYKQHHRQGFEIIGVSLDQDRQKLLAYTQEHEMPWPQFFDGHGWQNELALKYGVHSIPHTYLLDANGVIIGEDLRGEVLSKAVTAALAPSPSPAH